MENNVFKFYHLLFSNNCIVENFQIISRTHIKMTGYRKHSDFDDWEIGNVETIHHLFYEQIEINDEYIKDILPKREWESFYNSEYYNNEVRENKRPAIEYDMSSHILHLKKSAFNLANTVFENGYWGVINIYGETLLPPVHTKFTKLVNHLYIFEKNSTTSEIWDAQKQKIIVDCNKLSIVNYNDKYIVIQEKENLWYFLDINGEKIDEYQFTELYIMGPAAYYDHKGELLTVNHSGMRAKKDGKYGCFDQDGKLVIPFAIDLFEEYIDGIAKVKKGNLYGYVSSSGNVPIPIEYDFIENFNGKIGKTFKEYGSIDNKKTYISIYKIIAKKLGKWGCIDNLNTILTPFIYDKFELKKDSSGNWFLKALFVVKWGCIDMENNIIIPFEYEELDVINPNSLKAKKEGKWGYIDMKNNIITPFEYDELHITGSNSSRAKKSGKWGYINMENNIIIPFEYEGIGAFVDFLYEIEFKGSVMKNSDSIIKVKKEGKWGYIDRKNDIKIPFDYDEFGTTFKIKEDRNSTTISKIIIKASALQTK